MTGRKFQIGKCLFVYREKGLFLSVYVDDIKIGWKQNLDPIRKLLNNKVDLGESTTMPNKQRYCGQLQNHVRIANFRGES